MESLVGEKGIDDKSGGNHIVKCRKIVEVTPGTLDDLWDVRRDLCAVPLSDSCPKISEQGWWSIGDQSIGVKVRVVLRVELREQVIEVGTYSIFELKYLHDKSKVFILIFEINKR